MNYMWSVTQWEVGLGSYFIKTKFQVHVLGCDFLNIESSDLVACVEKRHPWHSFESVRNDLGYQNIGNAASRLWFMLFIVL